VWNCSQSEPPLKLRMLLPRSARASAANQKVLEDLIALTPLQWSAATPTGDRSVDVDVIAFHSDDLVMRVAGGAVEEVCGLGHDEMLAIPQVWTLLGRERQMQN
jgi:hypothetical protein